jgi:hypothetical protein
MGVQIPLETPWSACRFPNRDSTYVDTTLNVNRNPFALAMSRVILSVST